MENKEGNGPKITFEQDGFEKTSKEFTEQTARDFLSGNWDSINQHDLELLKALIKDSNPEEYKTIEKKATMGQE